MNSSLELLFKFLLRFKKFSLKNEENSSFYLIEDIYVDIMSDTVKFMYFDTQCPEAKWANIKDINLYSKD